MDFLISKLPTGTTHYLVGENTGPLIDILVFEKSITIQEHLGNSTFRLTLSVEKSTPEVLVFTTRPASIMSYFTYQIDIRIDISENAPIFAICSGIPIFWIFNETYILTLQNTTDLQI